MTKEINSNLKRQTLLNIIFNNLSPVASKRDGRQDSARTNIARGGRLRIDKDPTNGDS